MKKEIGNILAKWHESLGLRLSVFIMSITIALFAMTIGICIYLVDKMTTESAIAATEYQMNNAVEFINDNLWGIEKTVKSFALNAQSYTTTKEGCYELCEKMVRTDSSIVAATIMVRSDYYPDMPEGHHLFAPAVTHDPVTKKYHASNLVANSDDDFLYEKTDSNWIWTNKLDAGYWCEPYHDVYDTNDFLVTYSYPLHDKYGKIYAVLCADIRLSWLSERLYQLRLTENTKVMLISKESHFLVHHIPLFIQPQDEKLLGPDISKEVNENGTDTTIVSVYRKMMSGKSGTMEITKPAFFRLRNQTDTIPEGYVLYSPIVASGWSMAAVCPKSDIDARANSLVIRIMISSLIGLILMAAALYFMVRLMVRPYKTFAEVNADIKTAEHIQTSMICTDFPDSEALMGRSLFASMKPAKSIGGDLYDYHLDGDKLTFIVGDVSGKSVPAAFFMASTLTLFRVFSSKDRSPAEIITEINNSLSKDNESVMFVTLFVGKLNLRTCEMDFCNGGHNAPVIIHDGKARFIDLQTNLPAGVMEDIPYEGNTMTFVKGDYFVVYTDGVTEAKNTDDDLYSDERLLEFLSDKNFESATQLCESLSDDVKRYAGDAEQSDDITMMCIEF